MSKHVEIKLGPLGTGTILLDGVDLSQYTTGLMIENRAGHGSSIALTLRAGLDLDLAAAVMGIVVMMPCPHCRGWHVHYALDLVRGGYVVQRILMPVGNQWQEVSML